MSQKLDPDDLRFLKIIGLIVFLIVSMFITFGIGSLIHEGGHARACIALGGNVGGFRHWLRGAWTLAPATDCSIKPLPSWFGLEEISQRRDADAGELLLSSGAAPAGSTKGRIIG